MEQTSIGARLYRAALHLYPPAFRERFGDDMTELARHRFRVARDRGSLAAANTAVSLAADVVRTAPGQWVAAGRRHSGFVDSASGLPRDNMDIFIQDLRFSARALLRRPAFTVVAALTLALGIGANTAIFSVVSAVLIRALPYDHPDRLVVVWGSQGQQRGQGVVYADYVDWRARNHTFSDMGAFRGQSVNVTGGDTPERLTGTFATASFLRVIGARFVQGRAFTDAETEPTTRAPVAILSYETWQTRYGGRPGVLGTTITVNGTAFTIIAITVPNMPVPLGAPDITMPMGYYPNAHGLDRGTRGVAAIGRLRPGTTIDAARRDLSAIALQLEQDFPATNAGTGADLISLREQLVGRVRDSLYVILAAVAAVLLIACANVANLQLARGAARARELSVRAALGAGRGRIAQQLLTESVLLSVVGGTAGIAVAVGLKQVLVALIGPQLPVDPADVRLDAPVLAFALAIAVVTGALFGLVPAIKASRADLNDMLRSRIGGGLSHTGTRNTLVVVQLALSLALLASAGLITRSLIALQGVNPGFDSGHLLTAQFRLSSVKYDSPDKIWSMFERTVGELRALPGVESAALVRASPFSQNGETYPVAVDGRPPVLAGDAPQMQVNSVTPQYFSTMRIPLATGRDFTADDRAGTLPVIIVNRSFAEQTWPGESAIGKRVKVGDDDLRTVIGVAGDTRHYMLSETQMLQGYVPHAQRPQIFTSIVVRVRGGSDPLALARTVREAVWRVDRDQPVWRFRSMEQDLAAVVTSKKSMTWLTGLLALVALLVAAVGIYGVLSYTMSQRTQEMGIRIALGADARQVRRMVVGEGARLVAIAVVFGLAASLGKAPRRCCAANSSAWRRTIW